MSISAGAQIEAYLSQLGLELPAMSNPVGIYVKGVVVGNLLYLSGAGPHRPGQATWSGKVGREYTLEQGYEAAGHVCLQLLAAAKRILGDLSRIKRVVKLLGFVNCTEDFVDHPRVINGCSDLLVKLMGDAGRHARS
ncbi:MAG: RidA family protein, partial [Bacillota bacterium]|nr:RidA family protein [Bacillota bacterium]